MVFASLGVFDLNRSKTAALLEHELNTISEQIKSDYNTVTSYSVSLSESLSLELELRLAEKGVAPQDLAAHPEILRNL